MTVWPFAGRAGELSLVGSAFAGSDVDAVILTGPAGVGKTRLAGQALSGLGGARTAWVSATRAAAGIPFAAVAPLLPEDATAGGPLQLLRAAAAHLHGLGGRRQVAVGVDDAHLLDDASSTVVAHLVTSGAAFVVMTVRSGEPMADVLTRLCKDGQAELVEVPPLPHEVIYTLIDQAAPGQLDVRRRRRLHQIACGNPLALRELLHGAQPGGLTDLVASRLDGLDAAIRHAVELVACGEPLAVPIAEQLAGLPALAAAEDTDLIVAERSGARMQARLGHPLYGEVLRSRLSLSRATRVYRELAGALLRTPLRRRGDTLRAALWQVEAGAVSRPEVVRAGAWQAVGHADLELAERLARAARAAAPGLEADRLLAEILGYRGRPQEAATVLPATPPAQPGDRAAWAITRAETMYWGSDDTDAVWAALDTAAGHQAVEGSRALLLVYDARCHDAAQIAGEVMDRADVEAQALVWAATAGSAATGFLGRLDDARRIYERGAAVAKAHADTLPWATVEVDIGVCLAHLACGRPAEADAIAQAGYRAAVDGGASMMVVGWALYGGVVATARGHLAHADRLLTEALAGYEANDSFRMSRCCLAAHAAVKALRGEPDAYTMMDHADALAHPSNKIFEPWIETWRAWVAYAGGDLPAATTAATRAATLARHAAMPAVEALALYDQARLGYQPDLPRLDAINHNLARLLAKAARALAARDDASTLEAAGRELQTRGYDLHAAEAYTTAARRHRRHGRTAHAALAEAAADQARAGFPDARTPLLQHAQLSRLTPREREVLLLAAEHTSAQIAARLHLALTTVNNNLARAYTKLGITGRHQLRTLLDPSNALPNTDHPDDPPRRFDTPGVDSAADDRDPDPAAGQSRPPTPLAHQSAPCCGRGSAGGGR